VIFLIALGITVKVEMPLLMPLFRKK